MCHLHFISTLNVLIIYIPLDDAVDYYERAWTLGGQKNFKIGYKLAVNLYKLKLFTKSVEVCFDLAPSNPEQVKLKKDIMDKARLSLRSR